MQFFHDVFLTLSLPHQQEDKNNLKHPMKKKPTFVLSLSFFDITPTL